MPRHDLIQLRRGTSASWTTANSVLAEGEVGIELNGVASALKIGDGTSAWSSLSYLGITDGDKGDITVSASGATWTIDNNAVTNAKIQSVAWSKITGTPTTLSGYGITDAITSASVAAGYQPLDSDLTAIAALATTAFGRGLLTEASASTARSTLGLGTLATVSPTGTPDGTKFLRDDNSWQAVNLSAYLPLTGGTLTGAVTLSSSGLSSGSNSGFDVTLKAGSSVWHTSLAGFSEQNHVSFGYYGGTLSTDIGVSVASTGCYSWSNSGSNSNSTRTLILSQQSAGVLQIGTTSKNALGSLSLAGITASGTIVTRNGVSGTAIQVHNTYTDASNYERAKLAWESNVLRIGTEKAGTGSARALELQTDGTTRLTIASTGEVLVGRIQNATTNGSYLDLQGGMPSLVNGFNNTSKLTIANGGFELTAGPYGNISSTINSKANLFLQTDGTTRLTIGATGLFTIADALNIAVGTTTGTKIGTATTQKLGFFDKTPVVQPTAVADATDAASVITQLNALLSRMRDLGLIAT